MEIESLVNRRESMGPAIEGKEEIPASRRRDQSSFPGTIGITKYGTRNWAVWIDGELLAVTVYKKGAKAVVELLTDLIEGLTEGRAGN